MGCVKARITWHVLDYVENSSLGYYGRTEKPTDSMSKSFLTKLGNQDGYWTNNK